MKSFLGGCWCFEHSFVLYIFIFGRKTGDGKILKHEKRQFGEQGRRLWRGPNERNAAYIGLPYDTGREGMVETEFW